MTPKQYLKKTKDMVKQIEIVMQVYETAFTKVERIHLIIQQFKEETKDGIQESKRRPWL